MGKKRNVPEKLEELPNIGPAIASKLRSLGIGSAPELCDMDPYAMYDELCERTGKRHDPCLLDVFISAVAYMNGDPPKPWWSFTPERKKRMKANSE